ncbi:hypothetical protein ACET3Z_031859 [Daucus carota]
MKAPGASTQEKCRRCLPKQIVRDPRAGYEQSLSVLKHAKTDKEGMITKTSIMLGLGESEDELKEAMADLRGC